MVKTEAICGCGWQSGEGMTFANGGSYENTNTNELIKAVNMSKENDPIIVKVSQLTGSRLVNMDEFITMKAVITGNKDTVHAPSFVFGYVVSRAHRLNLSIDNKSDYERMLNEVYSILKRLGRLPDNI